MSNETLSAVTTVNTSAETVFAVLADPSNHAAIDGTGWVRDSLDGKCVTEARQVFRMAMYHDNHPDKTYEMVNRVEDFAPPRTISWKPGQFAEGTGELELGGWVWRYDLTPVSASETEVALTYDWSAVPDAVRQHIGFPPFPPEHLRNSLKHLADIAVQNAKG